MTDLTALLTPLETGPFSYTDAKGDGTTVAFTFTFVGPSPGYIRQSDIRPFLRDSDPDSDTYNEYTEIDYTENHWEISATQITFDTAIEASTDGENNLRIRRIMPKDKAYTTDNVDDIFKKKNIINSFLQQLYAQHEVLDGFTTESVAQNDLNMGLFRIVSLSDGINDDDAATVGQVSTIILEECANAIIEGIDDALVLAYKWANEAEGVQVDDGTRVGYSSYHWSKIAEDNADDASASAVEASNYADASEASAIASAASASAASDSADAAAASAASIIAADRNAEIVKIILGNSAFEIYPTVTGAYIGTTGDYTTFPATATHVAVSYDSGIVLAKIVGSASGAITAIDTSSVPWTATIGGTSYELIPVGLSKVLRAVELIAWGNSSQATLDISSTGYSWSDFKCIDVVSRDSSGLVHNPDQILTCILQNQPTTWQVRLGYNDNAYNYYLTLYANGAQTCNIYYADAGAVNIGCMMGYVYAYE